LFSKLKSILARRSPQQTFAIAALEAAQAAAEGVNWDDPAERTGASLYLILSKQFDLIGKPEGEFPYVPPFATDKSRGALLGTAIAVVRQQYGETPHNAIIDAAITAFTLAYGPENGKFYALQTFRESADGNEDVNFASDWAIRDTEGANRDDSPATPTAFYLAVAEMI
jgi:hypothetical protein